MRRLPLRAFGVVGGLGGLGAVYVAADERRRRLALRAAPALEESRSKALHLSRGFRVPCVQDLGTCSVFQQPRSDPWNVQ